ncbi:MULTISPECIES: hypothetical protein [Kitasatospora]|uniref:Uncharacterized protein n=1 Tax=Kitasatospora acidiphila TaxID=2567942 RepID=A0A540W4Q8_9ACTN|nr:MULTISPECIES: hypothetical protein [Kitasatospora]MDH6141395.1 putative oxidoreductase [Kitasatospora sp. GP30]TQF03982.1 hypothetical protein E6W39_19250 [Kitasatospora acidiphila]
MSSSADRAFGQESAALDEIELAGELMIAATDSSAERLPTARIDEVLLHRPAAGGAPETPPSPEPPDGLGPISSAAAG